MGVQFEVHLEDYFSALIPFQLWGHYANRERIIPMTYVLLNCLRRAGVKARFYVLGHIIQTHPTLLKTIEAEGHAFGSHGTFHTHGETQGDLSDAECQRLLNYHLIRKDTYPYRSPYWATTPKPGWSGGAYFRILPYAIFKRNLLRSRVFWLHPHDIDTEQPRLPQTPLRRVIGLKQAPDRLQRLLDEIRFDAHE